MTVSDKALMQAATEARATAYARYSGYRVGAAILDEHGRVHSGCNVENASYPEGTCAETNAIGAMVTAGGTRIVRIAVTGGADAGPDECTPCGGCRQRIREFSDARTVVVLFRADGSLRHATLEELLPQAFTSEALEGGR